jgi:hypothetical protein
MRARLLFVVTLFGFALPVEAQRRGNSVLSGMVLTDVGGLPVIGAEVAIPAEGLSATTDSAGAFRLTRVPQGELEVIVRRLGYTLMTHKVRFSGTDEARRNFFLNRPQTLDTVTVEARSTIPSFEEHRALGVGKFRTRAELEKLEQVSLGNVVREFNGIQIRSGRGGSNGAWAMAGRPRIGGDITPDAASASRGASPAC